LSSLLSPSNESETRENVWGYTTIPSVREILLIRSTRVAAELIRHGADGSWLAGLDLRNTHLTRAVGGG
jgi:hypothetical protein